MIRLACQTGAPDYHDDMAYAVLDLTLPLALGLLKQIGFMGILYTDDQSFHRAEYYKYDVSYVSSAIDLVPDDCLQRNEIEAELDNCEWVELPGPAGDLENEARTEADRRCIGQDSVLWQAYPKHSDRNEQVETQVLTRAQLVEVAGKLMQMKMQAEAAQSPTGRQKRRIEIT